MQKRMLLAFLAIGAMMFGAAESYAQSILTLPRASQHALVTQRVGITDISINYSRPLVNGRPIWGKLVPYGQVWRAGANENTIIEFSDPVTIEGKPLAKGVYGLHMIPGESDWTVIFSKNSSSWGSFSYDEKEDALRVTVKSHPDEMHEALTYDFDDPKPDAATVIMRWDKVAVPFKVEVNTKEVVGTSLHSQLRGRAQYEWQSWDEAAIYLIDNKINPEEALKDTDRSIQVEE